MNKTQKFLKAFFEEKEIKHETYEIDNHILNTEVVIENIMNCSDNEQKQIEMILRKIDFNNGSVEHFLKHLAKGLVEAY